MAPRPRDARPSRPCRRASSAAAHWPRAAQAVPAMVLPGHGLGWAPVGSCAAGLRGPPAIRPKIGKLPGRCSRKGASRRRAGPSTGCMGRPTTPGLGDRECNLHDSGRLRAIIVQNAFYPSSAGCPVGTGPPGRPVQSGVGLEGGRRRDIGRRRWYGPACPARAGKGAARSDLSGKDRLDLLLEAPGGTCDVPFNGRHLNAGERWAATPLPRGQLPESARLCLRDADFWGKGGERAKPGCPHRASAGFPGLASAGARISARRAGKRLSPRSAARRAPRQSHGCGPTGCRSGCPAREGAPPPPGG